MKKDYTKNYAFTLSEVFIVVLIIGIISVLGLGVQSIKTNTVNKFMSYSAFYNLQQGVKQLTNKGCNYIINDTNTDFYKPDGAISICSAASSVLPQYGNITTIGHLRRGLCPRLTEVFNIVGSPMCFLTVTGNPTNLSTFTPNFTTTNGMKFYNFGTSTAQTVYTVYIDIDGKNRSGNLNEDVLKFKITTAGDVLLDSASVAADNTDYITASVQYYDTNAQKYVPVVSGVSYKQAVCSANRVPASIPSYCGGYGADSHCPAVGNPCEVKLDRPRFLSF